MSTLEQIARIMASQEFDASDKAVVEWQFRLCGDFRMALWKAITLADEGNLERLRRGFPVEVEGYFRWIQDDLGTRLRAAGLEI